MHISLIHCSCFVVSLCVYVLLLKALVIFKSDVLILMFIILQLGPWLAVEVPDLVEKGLVKHKEQTTSK